MNTFSGNLRRDLEVRRYPILVYVMTPLAALVLQAWLQHFFVGYAWFDLPLVITVYFALVQRIPIQGTLMGAGMGLFQDALTSHAIGVNGIAKTVVGFLASSLGTRIDVESHTIRLTLTFLLSLLSSATYVFVYRGLLGINQQWTWFVEIFKAVGSTLIAAALFPALDRLQVRE